MSSLAFLVTELQVHKSAMIFQRQPDLLVTLGRLWRARLVENILMSERCLFLLSAGFGSRR